MCAVDARYIYRTGGKSKGKVGVECLRYDTKSDQWQKIPEMNQERWHHSSCKLAEYIYVFGKFNGRDLTN